MAKEKRELTLRYVAAVSAGKTVLARQLFAQLWELAA